MLIFFYSPSEVKDSKHKFNITLEGHLLAGSSVRLSLELNANFCKLTQSFCGPRVLRFL